MVNLSHPRHNKRASDAAKKNLSPVRLGKEFALPILLETAPTQRFVLIGSPRDKPGIVHTVYFNKQPVTERFSIDEEFTVTGYVSYSYLKTGSFVTGVVFATAKIHTEVTDYKLIVKGYASASSIQEDFKPNFNLEKLGIMLFTASDSSVLVVPSELDTALLVKAD